MFSEIKQYSLSEIGVFIKASRKIANNLKNENLLLSWIANNADKKGIDKAVHTIEKSSKTVKEQQEKINNDWKRLSAMAGKLK